MMGKYTAGVQKSGPSLKISIYKEWTRFAIKLKDGDEIQFKNVDELISLTDELGKFCPDVTHDLVRKRIVKFGHRLNRWGGSKEYLIFVWVEKNRRKLKRASSLSYKRLLFQVVCITCIVDAIQRIPQGFAHFPAGFDSGCFFNT